MPWPIRDSTGVEMSIGLASLTSRSNGPKGPETVLPPSTTLAKSGMNLLSQGSAPPLLC